MTLLSVIVLNYNGVKHNARCLDSLLSQEGDYEIIFADNGSTDGSYAQARERYPNRSIIWVDNGANLGYAGGNNTAARFASGEYLLFLNNDTELAPRMVPRLLSYLKASPRIAGGQCALIKDSERDKLEAAGVAVDVFGFCYARYRDADPKELLAEETIFSGVGAALVVSRKCFDAVGGFDESYFLLYEETDLCWRINLSGGTLRYFPEAYVYHVGSGTREKNPFQVELFIRNRLKTLRKNVGTLLLPLSVSGNVLGMLALAAAYALRRRPSLAAACLRGIWHGLSANVGESRRRIQLTRRRSDLQLIKDNRLRLPSIAGVIKNSKAYD